MVREAQQRRVPRWIKICGGVIATVAVLVVVLVLAWDWNWFRPLVERELAKQIGRDVHIGNFAIHLGRTSTVIADRIVVDNPKDFAEGEPIATIDRLAIDVELEPYIRDRRIVLPRIVIDRPRADLHTDADGKPNWTFEAGRPRGEAEAPVQLPEIGALQITDGNVHFAQPKLKTDFQVAVRTEDPGDGKEQRLLADAKGTYSGAPITARFAGGSLLSIGRAEPYPIDLTLANGPTQAHMKGTIERLMEFGGAKVDLEFRGSDLSLLYPLTGIPLAPTPPYQVKGALDYADKKIGFHRFKGTVGSSDLAGDLDVDFKPVRSKLTANVRSEKIILADLAGFIGGSPGRADAKGLTPLQKQERAKRDANPKLLPDTPINFPKLRTMDMDVVYKAGRIQTEDTPFDNLNVALTIDDGRINLHPLEFGIGQGRISGNILIDGRTEPTRAKADIDFRRLDFRRIMDATGAFKGTGIIGGSARIDTTGASLAQMLGRGDGELKLFMTGGDMSALLVNLAGLDFGNSVISALGLPDRTQIRCLVSDFALQKGVLNTRTMILDTTAANIVGSGKINLRDEVLDYHLSTEPKHFSIGSVSAPIDITGPMKNPSVLPNPGVLAARGGAAALLGVLLTPLGALIPTIQLGLGEDTDCNAVKASVEQAGKNATARTQQKAPVQRAPAPTQRAAPKPPEPAVQMPAMQQP